MEANDAMNNKCCLYSHNTTCSLRKYELVEILDDTIQKWELFMLAISSSFNNQLNIKQLKEMDNAPWL